MAKFIVVDLKNRVSHVFDSMPSDSISNLCIEVDNDNVAENWYYDKSTSTLYQYKPYTIDEVRRMRNELLLNSDWMVLEDSKYQASEQSSNLTAIKAYRQSLRDYPDDSVSYNENNLNLPTLTLS
tara:strand:+ start:122 stop:496 length:375 start_codon:yes stop_codon:yes gene_type:complete